MRKITPWNLLALVVILAGAATIYALDHAAFSRWARSGTRMAVGERYQLELPVGTHLVWYESMLGVPQANVDLVIDHVSGEDLPAFPPDDPPDFSIDGRNGRGLWEIDVVEAGSYVFTSNNDNDTAPGQDRSTDVLVLFKQPETYDALHRDRLLPRALGAAVVLALAGALYVVHGLQRSRG